MIMFNHTASARIARPSDINIPSPFVLPKATTKGMGRNTVAA